MCRIHNLFSNSLRYREILTSEEVSNYQSMLFMEKQRNIPIPQVIPHFSAIYVLWIQVTETALTSITTLTFPNPVLLVSCMPADTFGHLTHPQSHSSGSAPYSYILSYSLIYAPYTSTYTHKFWQFSLVIWTRSFPSVHLAILPFLFNPWKVINKSPMYS